MLDAAGGTEKPEEETKNLPAARSVPHGTRRIFTTGFPAWTPELGVSKRRNAAHPAGQQEISPPGSASGRAGEGGSGSCPATARSRR